MSSACARAYTGARAELAALIWLSLVDFVVDLEKGRMVIW